MSPVTDKIIIGTRGSNLALSQARSIQKLLEIDRELTGYRARLPAPPRVPPASGAVINLDEEEEEDEEEPDVDENVSLNRRRPSIDVTKWGNLNKNNFPHFIVNTITEDALAELTELHFGPDEHTPFKQQTFVTNYMKNSPYRGLLLYHGLGYIYLNHLLEKDIGISTTFEKYLH